jgi:ribulose-5-phosphate 4-epimerase/fuculose-1-phosphate aldolase
MERVQKKESPPMTTAATALKPSNDVRPAGIDEAEWALRVQLAAAYRIFDHVGWIELIFNHITMRVPGPETHILINPYGLMYSEVTASNLVKIDLDGNVVGPSNFPINPAGYIIHSALHRAREDAHCIMHTHTTTGMAVACKAEGLTPTNFYSAIIGDGVAYHDFEGTTTNADEQPRLVASIGDKNYVILRSRAARLRADHPRGLHPPVDPAARLRRPVRRRGDPRRDHPLRRGGGRAVAAGDGGLFRQHDLGCRYLQRHAAPHRRQGSELPDLGPPRQAPPRPTPSKFRHTERFRWRQDKCVGTDRGVEP